MDIELRNDRIPRNPFDRQFLDMGGQDGNSYGVRGVGSCEVISLGTAPG